jgi:Flp pilus assembly protein TadG
MNINGLRHARPVRCGATDRRRDRDAGGATVEFVIAFPVFLVLILAIVQFAIWEHAEHLAQSAARNALAAARSYGGTSADGERQAAAILAVADHGTLANTGVAVTRSATTVSVTVTGSAEAVIPGFHFSVSATASGPAEVFVTQ